jgi:hypothetical protein
MSVIFSTARLTIELDMWEDHDSEPSDYGKDSAYDDPATMESWSADEWRFMDVNAHVLWNGAKIGSGNIGAVEHGTMRYTDDNGDVQTVECDALEITVPDYGTTGDGTPTVISGSPASHVVMEALDEARAWATGAGTSNGPLMQALDAAGKWADPNAHKRTKTASDAPIEVADNDTTGG